MRLWRWMPRDFHMIFRRDSLAEVLWEYGEDELAEAALRLTEAELHRVQRLAAWHWEHDPEPETGPKLQNGRIMARAMIDFAEGRQRDTKRRRRRTRPKEQAYNAAYSASLAAGEPLESTPAEQGFFKRGLFRA